VFFIESEEEFALCPNCGSVLEYHSRVIRGLTDKTGEKSTYSIRVLKCVNQACPTTYHRELPDIIIPYQRYDAESIEEAISQSDADITVAADQSTIYRWRRWFSSKATHIIMALLSVTAVIECNADSSSLVIKDQDKPIGAIKGIVGRETNWMSETVRILLNSSKWIFNRSAFLTG